MLRVRPRRDALERVAAEREPLLEGIGPGSAPPALRVRDDRLTDTRRRLDVRAPDAAVGEHLRRTNVQVVARRVCVLGSLVPEVDAEVRLVRRLVLREACVA